MQNDAPQNPQSCSSSEESGPQPATFEAILEQRLSRRDTFRIGIVATFAAATGPSLFGRSRAEAASAVLTQANAAPASALPSIGAPAFRAVPSKVFTDDAFHVAEGYSYAVMLRWGDPVVEGAPAFDVRNQSAEAQAKQAGFNHDFQAFFSLGENAGVLFVNHEYTTGPSMLPNYNPNTTDLSLLKRWVDIELAAHGATIVEVERSSPSAPWKVRQGKRNRRITGETPMRLSGPAAGDERLRGDVLGTLNNCGGGVTPWGTVLTAEENFNQYFANAGKVTDARARAMHTRYGMPTGATDRKWERTHPRFDLEKNPNEAYKFGWVVEIDPDDPASVPVKRTALGRFKHEAAAGTVAKSGQYVVYSGDDERFDYLYKYVSYDKYDPKKGKANGDLLDKGTLYVARLWPDGTGEWIPLEHNRRAELRASNGWQDQADVLLRTRQAGDAVGATRMDRPEDVEVNPITGKVYVLMTNNARRTSAAPDEGERAANPRFDPRVGNRTGHIIELTERNDDHTAMNFRWEIFMLAGDPATGKTITSLKDVTATSTYFAGYAGAVSAIGAPDNVAFSPDGLMWIASDGAPSAIGYNDGLFCVPTTGPTRGEVRQLVSVPAGAELCGPVFTPDQSTVFVAVQHPGEDGSLFRTGDPTANTQSAWPDGPNTIPKSATVQVWHSGGKKIGS